MAIEVNRGIDAVYEVKVAIGFKEDGFWVRLEGADQPLDVNHISDGIVTTIGHPEREGFWDGSEIVGWGMRLPVLLQVSPQPIVILAECTRPDHCNQS